MPLACTAAVRCAGQHAARAGVARCLHGPHPAQTLDGTVSAPSVRPRARCGGKLPGRGKQGVLVAGEPLAAACSIRAVFGAREAGVRARVVCVVEQTLGADGGHGQSEVRDTGGVQRLLVQHHLNEETRAGWLRW